MTKIDQQYFQDLASASPETLCAGKSCSFNESDRTYNVKIWNDTFSIDPAKSQLELIDSPLSTSTHEYFAIFIMYYLLRVKQNSPQGKWISENDLPGGPTFFRGPHLIPTHHISDLFQNDLNAFKHRCETLGGKPVEMGDAAFSFSITPDIPIAILYWLGDEDFPAEAKILYDGSIEETLPLDIIYALAVEICNRVSIIKTVPEI